MATETTEDTDPHPSPNWGSPPLTMWIANAEEEIQQEVG